MLSLTPAQSKYSSINISKNVIGTTRITHCAHLRQRNASNVLSTKHKYHNLCTLADLLNCIKIPMLKRGSLIMYTSVLVELHHKHTQINCIDCAKCEEITKTEHVKYLVLKWNYTYFVPTIQEDKSLH